MCLGANEKGRDIKINATNKQKNMHFASAHNESEAEENYYLIIFILAFFFNVTN